MAFKGYHHANHIRDPLQVKAALVRSPPSLGGLKTGLPFCWVRNSLNNPLASLLPLKMSSLGILRALISRPR